MPTLQSGFELYPGNESRVERIPCMLKGGDYRPEDWEHGPNCENYHYQP